MTFLNYFFFYLMGFVLPQSLVGLRMLSLLSILSDAVSDAASHTPSILVLDDLDAIAGLVSE